MLEIGHSHRRAVLIMWLWAALIAFGTVVLSLYSGPELWLVLGAGLVLTVAGTFLLPVVSTPRIARHDLPAWNGREP
jgi:UDP-GlcNAc:undecaprenyl-phosphate GlcNAc-1-phosphate transferase